MDLGLPESPQSCGRRSKNERKGNVESSSKDERTDWVESAINGGSVLLSIVKEASSVAPIPYLKQAADVTLKIAEIVQAVKENKAAFQRLAQQAMELVTTLYISFQQSPNKTEWPPDGFNLVIYDLLDTLKDILAVIEQHLDRGKFKRLVYSVADAGKIEELRQRLQAAVAKFEVSSHLRIHHALSLILNNQTKEADTQRHENFSQAQHDSEASGLHERQFNNQLSISIIGSTSGQLRAFIQSPGGMINILFHTNGLWTPGIPVFDGAMPYTPLASIDWEHGREIRVYYVDKNYILQETCYSSKVGYWYIGELGNHNIQVAHNTSICAIQNNEENGGFFIRVYFQGPNSSAVRECKWENYQDGWMVGAPRVLPNALSGSSLAAVSFARGKKFEIRLYYQTEELLLIECGFSQLNNCWFRGDFNPGEVPERVPLCAIKLNGPEGLTLRVYWWNLQNEIHEFAYKYGRWVNEMKLVEGLAAGTQLSVAHWGNKEDSIRLYYQDAMGSVIHVQH